VLHVWLENKLEKAVLLKNGAFGRRFFWNPSPPALPVTDCDFRANLTDLIPDL
jgi:hypothetical protein